MENWSTTKFPVVYGMNLRVLSAATLSANLKSVTALPFFVFLSFSWSALLFKYEVKICPSEPVSGERIALPSYLFLPMIDSSVFGISTL